MERDSEPENGAERRKSWRAAALLIAVLSLLGWAAAGGVIWMLAR